MRRIHFIITGRVQGVGFRYFCQEQAVRLGLTGYARNIEDGCVEIEAQGDDGTLEEFAMAVSKGPRSARVANVEREEREVVSEESSFKIGH